MARDIEEFLRMAAKRRQQQKQQAGRPAAGQRAAPASGQQKRKPASTGRSVIRPTAIQPATDDEIVIIGGASEPHDPYQQSVSDHVRSHIDTKSLSEHASHLGEEVALADDKLVARLHSRFDHKLGDLLIDRKKSLHDTTTTVTAPDVAPIADELLTMLSNPRSVCQAIMLSEILKRPDFDL